MKLPRSIIWVVTALLALVMFDRLAASSDKPQPVPATVSVQGLSRIEAEYLYSDVTPALHSKIWYALRHLEFKRAMAYYKDAQYSTVKRMTKNPDGSVSIIVVTSCPNQPPRTFDMRTTGTWPGKEKN